MKTQKFVAEVLCVVLAALIYHEEVVYTKECSLEFALKDEISSEFNSPNHIRPPP